MPCRLGALQDRLGQHDERTQMDQLCVIARRGRGPNLVAACQYASTHQTLLGGSRGERPTAHKHTLTCANTFSRRFAPDKLPGVDTRRTS